MKKKEFLTEAKRKAIIADKEKIIIESFAKTFNKIKRIDENEINEFEEENSLYSRQQQNKDAYQDSGDLNSKINFDRIFDELLSTKPDYEYDESSSGRLSRKYHNKNVSNGDTIVRFNSNELSIQLKIYYNNVWEEDPDGASYWGTLHMSYEHWVDFGDKTLDDLLVKFGETELIEDYNGYGGTSIEKVKNKKLINTEFMELLSDKTQEKLYQQIQLLIEKNREYQDDDDYKKKNTKILDKTKKS